MKKIILIVLLLPTIVTSQKVNDLIERIGMVEFIVENPNGQFIFKQTKSWCTNFLNLNEKQAVKMDELFSEQYLEIVHVYKEYSAYRSPQSLHNLIDTILNHEERFRQQLSPSQLALYKLKTAECKLADNAKNKAFNNLFFSDEMLVSYRE